MSGTIHFEFTIDNESDPKIWRDGVTPPGWRQQRPNTGSYFCADLELHTIIRKG